MCRHSGSTYSTSSIGIKVLANFPNPVLMPYTAVQDVKESYTYKYIASYIAQIHTDTT